MAGTAAALAASMRRSIRRHSSVAFHRWFRGVNSQSSGHSHGGFVVLAWGDAGWVRFFSKEPAVRPDDYKRMKFFAWGSEPDQQAIMKSLGYTPVPLETTDILMMKIVIAQNSQQMGSTRWERVEK
jgi:hypothetical protein